MKKLILIFTLFFTNLAFAREFNFKPNYSLGYGFSESRNIPHYEYKSEVVGLVHFFDNQFPNENINLNLLGLGLSYNSDRDTVLMLSPLSFVYKKLFSIAYNLHLEKLNYGFSLNYQF